MGQGYTKVYYMFNVTGKKEQQCDSSMSAFIKLYEISWSSNMRILVILGSPRDLFYTILFKKKCQKVTRFYLEAYLTCVRYEYVWTF